MSPDRDLAHERDMEQLRREQLRQEEVDPEEVGLGQHVEDPWRDFPLSAEGAEDFPF